VTVVTISAAYGAGGSVIGPAVAERLGVAFVDRAVPSAVSERLAVPLEEAESRDQTPPGLLERLVTSAATTAQMFAGMPIADEALGEDVFRDTTERILRERAAAGAVILGRGAAMVLREWPDALHVRLTGDVERRIDQAMRLEGLDRDAAEQRLRDADRSRQAYVKFWYRCDPRDMRHYHLALDSTRLPLDTCAELVAAAATARLTAGG
jgi:cytidylate kinase